MHNSFQLTHTLKLEDKFDEDGEEHSSDGLHVSDNDSLSYSVLSASIKHQHRVFRVLSGT